MHNKFEAIKDVTHMRSRWLQRLRACSLPSVLLQERLHLVSPNLARDYTQRDRDTDRGTYCGNEGYIAETHSAMPTG